jgi:hypothetical protein
VKTAVLKSGATIDYDRVTEINETHPKEKEVGVQLYQFSRGKLGIVAVIPKRKVERLES